MVHDVAQVRIGVTRDAEFLDCNVRSPNSVICVRFVFPTKSMHHIRLGLRCNIIE